MELGLPEPQDMISSSTSSVFVAQEPVLPCCDCKNAEHSTDSSISSGSSYSSSLSHLPVFSEETTWQFRSHSLPILPQNQPPVFRNQGTSQPSFMLSELGKSELFQNLETLSSLSPQSTFINSLFESPDLHRQEEKTKDKRRSKSDLTSDHKPNIIFKERPLLSGSAPIQLSPLARWELEGHMAWKVCTLREQTVPLPVRESWAMLNYLTEVQGGVPEPEKPQIQLSMPIHQSTEQNINNESPDLPSLQLQRNTGVESGLNRTETRISQTLISGKQSQPGDGPQILESRPLMTSIDILLPKSLGADITQEEMTLLKKDPKHVLELNIKQRVLGLPEKRIQPQQTQVPNMELTPQLPYQVTDSVKVTPLALLQVMDSMGMIPDSHSEVIESVGLFQWPPNEVEKPMEAMETVHVSQKPSYQVIKSVEVTPRPQQQVMESRKITSRQLNQVIDNVKVTPIALLQVMDSMGMIKKSHPPIIQSMGMTPTMQYQVMESVKRSTLLDHQVIQPGKMNPRLQHAVIETVEITPGPHKVMQSVHVTSRPQSQVAESLKITPGPICQNMKSFETIPRPLHQVMDYMKVTPVALLQAMDFMGIIPPTKSHVIESGGLIPDTQSQIANLTPRAIQSDCLTSSSFTTIGTFGVVESVGLPPKPPHKVMESGGVIPISQANSRSLELTPGSCIQVPDFEGMTPQPYNQDCKI
ncbi:uncharacterized protein [Bos taurus]|uniref:uncharacterized protein n=1 Tax=Bos taurus TaxID=9913 RepID=UPI0028CBBC42|nr:uncharacterized protein LOC132346526 [Bos taurus]